MRSKRFLTLILLALTLLAFASCDAKEERPAYSWPAPTSSASLDTESAPPPEDSVVRLMAVGDNLIHNVIYNQAKERGTAELEYDFSYVYERVKPIIQKADVAFINQETVLAGKYFEPSNFPRFCTPTEMGDCLLDVGFNVFNHANNHMLDKGQKGIFATLEYWDTKTDEDICVLGMYKDENDLFSCHYIEKNGIKIGFFGFTEHTNGLPVPDGMTERIVYAGQEDVIKKAVNVMKAECDLVVVSAHWGEENYSERTTTSLTSLEKQLSQKLADWGVDLIIGTHPHVIQPMKWLERADGGRTFCIYSLGNFVSAMNGPCNMLGGLVDLDIRKNNVTGEVNIENICYVPIVTHYETSMRNVRLYPLSEYTEELASSHGCKSKTYSGFSLSYLNRVVNDNIEEGYLFEK